MRACLILCPLHPIRAQDPRNFLKTTPDSSPVIVPLRWALLLPFHKGNRLRAGRDLPQALSCHHQGWPTVDHASEAEMTRTTFLQSRIVLTSLLPGHGACPFFCLGGSSQNSLLPALSRPQVLLGASCCVISFNSNTTTSR